MAHAAEFVAYSNRTVGESCSGCSQLSAPLTPLVALPGVWCGVIRAVARDVSMLWLPPALHCAAPDRAAAEAEAEASLSLSLSRVEADSAGVSREVDSALGLERGR